MLTTKAIAYAKKILILEHKLNNADITKEEQDKVQLAIENIIDEVCETYEPTAMYKIDEQISILEKQGVMS